MKGYFIITTIYLIAVFILLRSYRKKTSQTETVQENIIAVPKSYVINIIENQDGIDYKEYADVSLNISDILKKKTLSEQDKPVPPEETPSQENKISYNDIDFSQYEPINI